MKNWKRLIATGLVASVALLGAACGDDADTGTDTGVTSTETAPAGGDTGTDTMAPTETES